MNGKVSVVFNHNCFWKMKDFSRLAPLQAVTYTVKVVWTKLCEIYALLIHTTSRKYHMAYRFVPFPMTLDDFRGHLPVAGLIISNSTNICTTFRAVSTDTACRAVLGNSWASCEMLFVGWHVCRCCALWVLVPMSAIFLVVLKSCFMWHALLITRWLPVGTINGH